MLSPISLAYKQEGREKRSFGDGQELRLICQLLAVAKLEFRAAAWE